MVAQSKLKRESKPSKRLFIAQSPINGGQGGLGFYIAPRQRVKDREIVSNFGLVDLCTIDKVKTTRTCWSRYGISVSTKTAAALGVVLSDAFDYVLIPRAVSHQAYLYGDQPRSTPLPEIDPRNKGALINSALDGESAHLVWKVTYSSITKQWGVDIIASRNFTTRSTAVELLLYYGVVYVSTIQAAKTRAAELSKIPIKRFESKKGGTFCDKCNRFFKTKAKWAPHMKSKCNQNKRQM